MTDIENDTLWLNGPMMGRRTSEQSGGDDPVGADYFLDGEVVKIDGTTMIKSDSPNNKHPASTKAGCGCSARGCLWFWPTEDHCIYAGHIAEAHDVQYPPRLIFLYKEKPTYIAVPVLSRKAKPLGKLNLKK